MELFLFNKNGTLESLQLSETNKAKFFSDKITVIYNPKSKVINVWVGEMVSGTEKKQIPLIQKNIKQKYGLTKDAEQIVVKQRQELHKFLEESDETKGKIRFPEDVWQKKRADSIQSVKEGLAKVKQKIESDDTKGAEIEIKKYVTLATLSGNKELIDSANEIKRMYKEKQTKFFEARVEELTEHANQTLGEGDIPRSIQEFEKIKEIIEEQKKNIESEP
jgi:uncharacterized protein YqkB